MYGIIQALNPLLRENLRFPILWKYLHQSSHTGTGL